MKQISILFALIMLSLSSTMSAMTPIELKINGVSLPFVKDAVVPESMNEQFLKGVYCGSASDLKDAQIIITRFEYADNNTNPDICIALLKVDYDYYLATYKLKGGIIDGALLLKKDDIELGCDFSNSRGNMMDAQSPYITLDKGTVSVKRNFITHINAYDKGGPIMREDGSVTMIYSVDKNGKISLSMGPQHSKFTVAENASVPGRSTGRGGTEVTESDHCRTLGFGMNVIMFYVTPVSQENEETANRLEVLLKQFDEMMAKAKNHEFKGAAKCMVELEMIQKGMVMRNPQLWLSWLDKNPKTKSMETLNKSLEDEVFKAELLKEVKSLKDKKLRKAWEKRLK